MNDTNEETVNNDPETYFIREYKGYSFYDTPGKAGERVLEIRLWQKGTVHSFFLKANDPQLVNKAIEVAKDWVNANPLPGETPIDVPEKKKSSPKTKKEKKAEIDTKSEAYRDDPDHPQSDKAVSELVETLLEKPADEEIKVTDSRAIAGDTETETSNSSNNNEDQMNFFQQLAATGAVDMSIRILEKNGKLTMEIRPGPDSSKIKPIRVTGTPQELDEGFFAVIAPGIKEIQGLTTNLEEVKKDAAAQAEKKTESRPAPKKKTVRKPAVRKPVAKKPAAKKPAAKKPAQKKPGPKKAAPPKQEKKRPEKKAPVKKPVEKPKVEEPVKEQEPSLFGELVD